MLSGSGVLVGQAPAVCSFSSTRLLQHVQLPQSLAPTGHSGQQHLVASSFPGQPLWGSFVTESL